MRCIADMRWKHLEAVGMAGWGTGEPCIAVSLFEWMNMTGKALGCTEAGGRPHQDFPWRPLSPSAQPWRHPLVWPPSLSASAQCLLCGGGVGASFGQMKGISIKPSPTEHRTCVGDLTVSVLRPGGDEWSCRQISNEAALRGRLSHCAGRRLCMEQRNPLLVFGDLSSLFLSCPHCRKSICCRL